MSMRKVPFVLDEYYHLYNRGNSKQVIFRGKQDYDRFIGLLYMCNTPEGFKTDFLPKNKQIFDLEHSDNLVAIGAYCLMPNHFHILITPLVENGLSLFMQKVATAYVMYFNQKYARSGGLFEGKFKSQHIDTDRYLKYMFAYIHLNPVKLIQKNWKAAGIRNIQTATSFLRQYHYSSYLDHSGTDRPENKILKSGKFSKYFAKKKDWVKEMKEWLMYTP